MDTQIESANATAGVSVKQQSKIKTKPLFVVFLILVSSAMAMVLWATYPPKGQQNKTLVIEKGMSVAQITERAKEEHIVRSAFLLYAILEYAHNSKNIFAGSYSFEEPHSVFEVAQKLADNDIDPELVAVTIPEGATRKDIAKTAQLKNQQFDVAAFLSLTEGKEGYLFPETYFVPPDFTAEELVAFIEKTYQEKVGPLRPQFEANGRTEQEVLTLASLLERETNSEESMKVVAGILENRMEIGMALQVDASLEYILEKPLKELTPEDLKIDSPYNTYSHNGLTPTPIGNPGLAAIDAILNPTKSSYFYYITDEQGVFHYAKTFEEHKLNVQKYLR